MSSPLLIGRNFIKFYKDCGGTGIMRHIYHIWFFKKFIYFNWTIISLQYCGGFLPYINMNQLRVHVCPPILKHPPTSLPITSLWVVPEHRLWVHCFTHWIALVIYFTYSSEEREEAHQNTGHWRQRKQCEPGYKGIKTHTVLLKSTIIHSG